MASKRPLDLDQLAAQTRAGDGSARNGREDRLAEELARAYEQLAAAQRRHEEKGDGGKPN